MNSYKNITDRYLKYNKKRSILNICGVILSIALITAVGLFIISMKNAFVQDEIKINGSFHISMAKSDDITYEKLKNNPKIDKMGLSENIDSIILKDSKKLKLNKFNKDALELLPYKAVEGTLPKGEGEIALESWVLNYMDKSPKVGDTIELKLSNGENPKFKIVGLITNDVGSQYSGEALGIIYSDKFNIDKCNMYMTISKKCDISDTIKELKNTFKNISSNESVLRVLGEGEDKYITKNMYFVAAIIIGIVVIATVAVIYNSFQISVVERIKQFGLLKAVGATSKQIRKIVLREATIISLIGIPLGLISGAFAVFVVIKIFGMMSNYAFGTMKFVMPWYVMVISAIVGLFSIYASALIPSKLACKVSPLVAISSRTSIIKDKVNKKRGRIVKKFLSINSLMAFKNIKRNRKRFNITVFSITISITLAIVFQSYINMMGNFTANTTENLKTHFNIEGLRDKEGKSSLTQNIVMEIQSNELVKNAVISYGTYASKALLTEAQKDNSVENIEKNVYSKTVFEGKEINSVNLLCDIYNEEKLENTASYVVSGKIDKKKMVEDNGVIIVKNNLFVGNGKKYVGPISNLKVGDSFYIDKNLVYKDIFSNIGKDEQDITAFDKNNIIKLKVSAIVDKVPYDGLPSTNMYITPQYLKIIVPSDVMKNICNKNVETLPLKRAEIILKDEGKEKEFENWIQPLGDRNGLKVMNMLQANKEIKGSTLQIKILLYGFISVISLIGCVNIINTITTNLLLRRKEIASLSALGMTYKNLKTMILSEGILYGLYGVLYGGVIGSVLSYILSLPMRNVLGFKWQIPWESIIVSGIVAIVISLIAVIKPLNLIKKENTIDLIREEA